MHYKGSRLEAAHVNARPEKENKVNKKNKIDAWVPRDRASCIVKFEIAGAGWSPTLKFDSSDD